MSDSLIVFASKQEFNSIFPNVSAVVASSSPVFVDGLYDVGVCGVGSVAFATNLSYFLSQKKYRRVFLLGICGAYLNRGLNVGDVVRVDSETVGDMGAQNFDGHFIPWKDISSDKVIYNSAPARDLPFGLASIPSVAGVTVNCCTGTEYLSLRRASMFDADVESMEGAPFFSICARFGVAGYQFRGVSNIATDRDVSAWRILEALSALKAAVLNPEFFK